jgi:hypothetical protein
MCSIERHTVIAMGDVAWKVKPSSCMMVGGVEFLKLPATDVGFVKLTCGDEVKKLPKNASLVGVNGMIELLELRNSVNDTANQAEVADKGAAALFGDAIEAPAKRPRRGATAMKEMWASPTTIDVPIPLPDGVTMTVPMVKPARPTDLIAIPLNAEYIEHVVLFIRSIGITEDSLVNKRSYSKSAETGIWTLAGDKGYVVRMPNGKYKRAKHIDEARSIASGSECVLATCADEANTVA